MNIVAAVTAAGANDVMDGERFSTNHRVCRRCPQLDAMTGVCRRHGIPVWPTVGRATFHCDIGGF